MGLAHNKIQSMHKVLEESN